MKSLPPKAARSFRKRLVRVAIVVLILVAALGALAWEKLLHQYPHTLPSNDALAEFKYGSIGVEESGGIPYWIWEVLPQIFSEHLPGPGGYASLGMVWEPGMEMPIGFTKRRIGYDRVGINCAACHTGSYRLTTSEGRTTVTHVVPGAPASRLDVQGYLHFLSACSADPRFNADTILSAIAYNHRMSAVDNALYRYVLIPGTKKALQQQAVGAQWQQLRPPWGAGRIDPFNPVKFGMLKMDPAGDPTVGNSDMMPFWAMDERRTAKGIQLHWDGLSTDLLDCSLAGALGDGATTKSLPIAKVQRMVNVARTLPPPQWPESIDRAQATVGQKIYQASCARCHAPSGLLVNIPVDLRADDAGAQMTDANRLAMWNAPDAQGQLPFEIYNRFADAYPWDLNTFVPTDSYISVPLRGLWLRGPFLHNGSVPTVLDLLQPPPSASETRELIEKVQPGMYEWMNENLATYQRFQYRKGDKAWQRLLELVPQWVTSARKANVRPPIFFRGSDLVDTERLGFVCDGSDSTPTIQPFVYATFIQGNSNAGHLYGTDLSEEDKLALVEYLKDLSEQGETHDR